MKFLLLITLIFNSVICLSSDKIVLIPGAFSSGDQLYLNKLTPFLGPIKQKSYFKHLKIALESNGYDVIVCPKKKSQDMIDINQRARDCRRYLSFLLLKNPSNRFHLFGHSMGGLVARKMIESYPLSLFIKTVTTISTPHRGSFLANFVIDKLDKNESMGKFLKLVEITPEKKKYIKQLMTINGENVYANALKNPRKIPVYSISNFKKNYYNTALAVTQSLIPETNDGVIETSSMKFGIHLGQIKADHMETICLMYTKKSSGCKSSLKVILKHYSDLKKI